MANMTIRNSVCLLLYVAKILLLFIFNGLIASLFNALSVTHIRLGWCKDVNNTVPYFLSCV